MDTIKYRQNTKNHRKRLCLIMMSVQAEFNRRIIKGMADQADALSSACTGNEVVCHCSASTFFVVGTHASGFAGKQRHARAVTEAVARIRGDQIRPQLDFEMFYDFPNEQNITQHAAVQARDRHDADAVPAECEKALTSYRLCAILKTDSSFAPSCRKTKPGLDE